MKQDLVIRHIKEVAQRIVPKGGQVLLYGSRARGEAHEGSDWDLLIILDKPKIEKGDYDNVVFPFTSLGWDIGEDIIIMLKDAFDIEYEIIPKIRNYHPIHD